MTQPPDSPDKTHLSPLRRVLHNTSWLTGSQVVVALLSFAQVAIVIRALGAEGFGSFALILTVVLTTGRLLSPRTLEAVVKFVPMFREQGRFDRASGAVQFCLAIEFAAATAAVLLLWVAATPIAELLLKDAGAAGPLRLYALVLLFQSAAEPLTGLLRAVNRFGPIAVYNVVLAVVRLAVVTAAAWLTPTLTGVAFAILLANAAAVGLLTLFALRATPDMAWCRLGMNAVRSMGAATGEVWRFCLLGSAASVAQVIALYSDTLVVGFFATPGAAGAYYLAKQIAMQLGLVSMPIFNAVFPEISTLVARKQLAELIAMLKRMTAVMFLTALPICLVATLVGPAVLVALFGPEYAVAGPLFQIIIWHYLFWLPMIWFPGLLLSTGRAAIATLHNWLDAATYLGLLIAMTWQWDGIGAAAAFLCRFAICAFMAGVVVWKIRGNLLGRQANDAAERPTAEGLPRAA